MFLTCVLLFTASASSSSLSSSSSSSATNDNDDGESDNGECERYGPHELKYTVFDPRFYRELQWLHDTYFSVLAAMATILDGVQDRMGPSEESKRDYEALKTGTHTHAFFCRLNLYEIYDKIHM